MPGCTRSLLASGEDCHTAVVQTEIMNATDADSGTCNRKWRVTFDENVHTPNNNHLLRSIEWAVGERDGQSTARSPKDSSSYGPVLLGVIDLSTTL